MDTRVASPVEGVRKQTEKDVVPETNTITLSLLGESTSSDAESSQVENEVDISVQASS